MGWIYLIIAGLLEIGFALSLKLLNKHKGLLWAIIFLVCTFGSFYFSYKSLSNIPIGTAYAVWTGIEVIGTVLCGVLIFKKLVTLMHIAFLFLIIVAVTGLKLSTN